MFAKNLKPSLTLQLRSEPKVNLVYNVEIIQGNNTTTLFTSENYYQALAVAKKVFNDLSKNSDQVGDIEVILESLHGRGVSYEINNFCADFGFEDDESFYQELVSEFEILKLKNPSKANTIFRELVETHKLNEYQELRLLGFIRKTTNG